MARLVSIEHCDECGFDGGHWTDGQAIERLAELPTLWAQSIGGIGLADLLGRQIPQMWSIAEYTDHVRTTMFGMRFVLDMVLTEPGVDLGDPPDPGFDPEPRPIDVSQAQRGFEQEVRHLRERLTALRPEQWSTSAVLSGEQIDVHWIVRHSVHDVSHHLGDVERLRAALG